MELVQKHLGWISDNVSNEHIFRRELLLICFTLLLARTMPRTCNVFEQMDFRGPFTRKNEPAYKVSVQNYLWDAVARQSLQPSFERRIDGYGVYHAPNDKPRWKGRTDNT